MTRSSAEFTDGQKLFDSATVGSVVNIFLVILFLPGAYRLAVAGRRPSFYENLLPTQYIVVQCDKKCFFKQTKCPRLYTILTYILK
jgi:hypothetical protein